MNDTFTWLLLSDFTIDPLADCLRKSKNPCMPCMIGPIDQVRQVIHQADHECWRSIPQGAVVWTQPFKAVPAFSKLYYEGATDLEAVYEEVRDYARSLKCLATKVSLLIVPVWTLPAHLAGDGVADYRNRTGIRNVLGRMNLLLAEELEAYENVFLLSTEKWLIRSVSSANEALWYLGKIPFSREVFVQAAEDIIASVQAFYGTTRKVLVLDLDNTLWGGVIGEDGIDGILLGGPDPAGEAYQDFQRHLLALKNNGTLLGIVSKNEEGNAFEAIERHPDMVLRRKDFSSWRINWEDKARNIIHMAEELNLGVDSFVFIDDNPVERDRIRKALPAVFVPDWPEDPIYYSRALSELKCFSGSARSGEDRERTRYYREEADRRKALEELTSIEDWLDSLQLRLTVEEVGRSNIVRAVQLLNKTNQFNLLTRRMGQTEFAEFIGGEGRRAFLFRLNDRLGDYGSIGLATIELKEEALGVMDFLLSCRAMGRGVEQGMLYVLAQFAGMIGRQKMTACYVPTPKNKPCASFLPVHGFEEQVRSVWTVSCEDIRKPAYIEIISPIMIDH
ncbi:HAD-IIIC family phosphatase [Paenibacillus sp. TH7-28]